jgi:hypothetical protein
VTPVPPVTPLSPAPVAKPLRVIALTAPRRVKLTRARRGVTVTMALPRGTTAVRYALARGARSVERRIVARRRGASSLTLKVRRTGTYRLVVTPVGDAAGVGRAVSFTVV